MSLAKILDDVEEATGFSRTDTTERARVVSKINDAAKELFASIDLEEAKKEEVFDFDVDSQQVALPPYVGKVRGMRYYDSRLMIPLDHMGNRYNYGLFDRDTWYLHWREKENAALARRIENQSTLTFEVPIIEDSNVVIDILGPTDNSYRYAETVTIPAGSLSVETVGNYKSPLASIKKNSLTKYDVLIKDANGNLLGKILNSQNYAEYKIYQIVDSDVASLPEGTAVEVLFKPKFIPFVNDADEFVAGPDYDKAIFWKYMEHNAKNPDIALAYQTKHQQVVDLYQEDSRISKRRFINFIPGPWFKLYGYFRRIKF